MHTQPQIKEAAFCCPGKSLEIKNLFCKRDQARLAAVITNKQSEMIKQINTRTVNVTTHNSRSFPNRYQRQKSVFQMNFRADLSSRVIFQLLL